MSSVCFIHVIFLSPPLRSEYFLLPHQTLLISLAAPTFFLAPTPIIDNDHSLCHLFHVFIIKYNAFLNVHSIIKSYISINLVHSFVTNAIHYNNITSHKGQGIISSLKVVNFLLNALMFFLRIWCRQY